MACPGVWGLFSTISRKKRLGDDDELYQTQLQRSLTTFQLVLMGLGGMIGAGLYVLTGVEAKEVTGPAVVVSYTIAAIASIFSAVCYVEFACRVPRTGSAYTFTYIAVGEIWAFLIGWNLILEYAISGASVATAFTGYVDSLTGYAISNFTVETIMGGKLWNVSFLAPYPDIFSSLVVILITLLVICGAKVSSWTNAIFLIINMIVIAVIIVLGFSKADIRNWQDYGGFVPNGPGSVISGAATLFFSYVGFDTIAMANEETIDPRTSIPRATFISILLTSVIYITASAVLTLMVPYPELDESSAFAAAFARFGIEWAKWVVGVGALCAIFTSILMSIYCLPRSLYAMSRDGLLFQWLGTVSDVTKVPVYGSIFAMILVVLPTMFFTLSQLVGFLSIGVLFAYTFVSASVLILRYQKDSFQSPLDDSLEMEASDDVSKKDPPARKASADSNEPSQDDDDILLVATSALPGTLKPQFRSLPVIKELARFRPGLVVNVCLFLSIFFIICTSAIMEQGSYFLGEGSWWIIFLLVISSLLAILSALVIPLHQQNEPSGNYFRVSLFHSEALA